MVAEPRVPILVNVAGRTEEDYVQVAEAPATRICLGSNSISPAPMFGKGISFGTDAKTVYKLVSRVRQVCLALGG